MKCIKSPDGEKILRVTEDKAVTMVSMEKWTYCPKSEWKEKVRDKQTDNKNNNKKEKK